MATILPEVYFLVKKRGQAAIEFLTTYGWAMMAIALSIGALLYFDVLDSDRYVREECNTGNQLQCLEVYVNNDGTAIFRILNNYQVPVDVKISVTGDGTGDSTTKTITPGGVGEIQINTLNTDANPGDAVQLDLLINYGREGNTNYNLTGSASSRIVETS